MVDLKSTITFTIIMVTCLFNIWLVTKKMKVASPVFKSANIIVYSLQAAVSGGLAIYFLIESPSDYSRFALDLIVPIVYVIPLVVLLIWYLILEKS